MFAALRPEIDANRGGVRIPLLGLAISDLSRQSGEPLAGRVSYLERTPLPEAELPVSDLADPNLVNIGQASGQVPKGALARQRRSARAARHREFARPPQGHLVARASWKGSVVEQVAAALASAAQPDFYRTAAVTELNL